MEAFADSPVAVGRRVEPVVEVVDVLGSEQAESVDEMKVVVARVAARVYDVGFDLSDAAQGQGADEELVGTRRGVEALVASEDCRSGIDFDGGADDRCDE